MAPLLICLFIMLKKFAAPAVVLASLLSLGACQRDAAPPPPARVHTEARAPQPQSCNDHFVDGQSPRITNP
jgi:endonuclease G